MNLANWFARRESERAKKMAKKIVFELNTKIINRITSSTVTQYLHDIPRQRKKKTIDLTICFIELYLTIENIQC